VVVTWCWFAAAAASMFNCFRMFFMKKWRWGAGCYAKQLQQLPALTHHMSLSLPTSCTWCFLTYHHLFVVFESVLWWCC
jgi:hypothetical protein